MGDDGVCVCFSVGVGMYNVGIYVKCIMDGWVGGMCGV